MNMKHISLLLPLVAVFVNSYAGLNPTQEIEYKGVKAAFEQFFYLAEFRDNVRIYHPTKDDASGNYSYVSFSFVRDYPAGPSADQLISKEEVKTMKELLEKKNIDIDNLENGITYCPGDDSNEPAMYVTKKGKKVDCNEFYKLIDKMVEQQKKQ